MELHSIGPAWAWEENGRWYFTPYKSMAPAEAIEVERVVLDGMIVLSQYDGQHGRFIRGAEQVG